MRTKLRRQLTVTYPHRSSPSCATLPSCISLRRSAGRPTRRKTRFVQCRFQDGQPKKGAGSKSVSQLLLLMTRRRLKLVEAAVWVLRDLLLFWASFLFSQLEILYQVPWGRGTHTGCFCCMTLAVTHQQAKRNRTTTLLSCTTPKLASHWRGTASKAQAPKRHLHAAKSSRLQLNQKHLKSSNSTRHLKNYFLLTCSGKVLCYSHVLTWETRRRQNHISNSTWPILQCYICRVSLYSLSKAALP